MRLLISCSVLMLSVFSLAAAGLETQTNGLPKAPPDWKVELVAQTPQLIHPSVVCTAPDGRVFVAQDPMDMPGPTDQPIDSILCFHPDGKVSLFATNLYAVFGLAYLDGKVYVHHAPKVSVFVDDQGVGRDRVDLIDQTVPEPWSGTQLNDHIPSNFRLGMDGYLYMSVGDKGIFGMVGRDGSKAELHGGGVVRLRPNGTELEVYATGTRNHLDLALTAEDEIFTYDNTDDGHGWWTRVTHLVDGGFYGYPHDYKPQRPYTLWMMKDYGGGSPTGALAYNEDGLPEHYNGNLFMCEWGKRKLVRFVVARQGGSFRIESQEDFLTENGQPFRPLGITMTPEGDGFYIADWNHGGWKSPAPAGRLLKVTYTGPSRAQAKPSWFKPAAMGQPTRTAPADFVEGLRHPAQSVRLVAQRRLAQRGVEMVPLLVKLLQDKQAPAHARWSAIWTLDSIDGGKAGRSAILQALNDGDTSVRRQAIRQLGTRHVKSALNALVPLLRNEDGSTRFQAATALGRLGAEAAIPGLLVSLEEKDLFIRFAAFKALNRIALANDSAWAILAAGLRDPSSARREGILFAMRETYQEKNVQALAAVLRDQQVPPQGRAAALTVLAELHHQRPAWDAKWWGTQPIKTPPPAKSVAWTGTTQVIESVRLALNDTESEVRRAAVEGVMITGDKESAPRLRDLFAQEPTLRQAVLRTLGVFKDEASAPLVADLLTHPDKAGDPALLLESITTAGAVGGKTMVDLLIQVAANPPSTALQVPSLEALGNLKAVHAVPVLSQSLRHTDTKVRQAAAAALVLIKGPAATEALLGLLGESNPEWRRLAVSSLGSLKNKELVPALLKTFADAPTRTEAIVALTQTPSLQALDAYLAGLGDQNASLRDQSRRALSAIQEPALGPIEEKLRSAPISSVAMSGLQRVYEKHQKARLGIIFTAATKPTSLEAYADFAASARGDVEHGKKLFFDTQGVACVKCHRVGATGGEVGPDLTGVAAKYGRAQLVESMLYPSKLILDGYQQTTVFTRDGEVTSGILRGETSEDLSLTDTEGRKHVIKKSQVEQRKLSELSLMPDGLQAALTLQDFADLTAYLETLKENKSQK